MAGRLGHGQPWTTLNTYAAFLLERDQAAADELATLLEDPANNDRRSTNGERGSSGERRIAEGT